MKKIIRNKALMIIAFAEIVSGIGSWITIMALFSLVVFDNGGSVVASSGILLASLAPMMIFMSIGGQLSDRFNRKTIMIMSQLAAAVVVSGLVFARSLPWIYTLLALQAVCTGLMTPARMAAVPQVVAVEQLSRANALLQQLNGLLKVFGPMLAGVLLVFMVPQQAIILDVVSYVLSALILCGLPALDPIRSGQALMTADGTEAHAETQPHTLKQVFRATPLLGWLFGASFLMIVAVMGFDVFASVLTRDILAADAGFFGFVISLVGGGAIVAALYVMLQRGPARPWRDLLAGMLLLASIPGAIPLILWLDQPGVARGVLAVAAFIGGIGSGLVMTQLTTLLQTMAPPSSMGRIMGLFNTVMIMGQLIALVVVPLLVPALISMSSYFSVAACSIILVVTGMVLALRNYERQPAFAH